MILIKSLNTIPSHLEKSPTQYYPSSSLLNLMCNVILTVRFTVVRGDLGVSPVRPVTHCRNSEIKVDMTGVYLPTPYLLLHFIQFKRRTITHRMREARDE